MSINILNSILILLACSVIVVAVFRRLHIPSILAYLFVGIVVGPHALEWVPHTEDAHFLAEFGVVFLLFSIGLEFSMARLLAMKKEVLGLGSIQVILTTIFVGSFAWFLGISSGAAIIIGGVLAMSSTAIVIKQLKDQQELGLPHGKLSVAILLFQDIAVVPFLILVAVLSNAEQSTLIWDLSWALIKGLSVIGVMLLLGWWVLRPLFAAIVFAHSSELFTLTALLFAIAAAWLSHFTGLSFALGAFLAGMILGETEFRHQIEADIRPFRDVLLGLFFVTMGMMLDLHILPEIFPWILLLVLGIIIFKAALIIGFCMLFGASPGVSMRTGLVLAQGGEFGLALLTIAFTNNLIETVIAQAVLAAIIISMGISPILIKFNRTIQSRLCSDDCKHDLQRIENNAMATDLSGHVIIAGYGKTGCSLGHLLKHQGFSFVALDLNAARVRDARNNGDIVYYGDARHHVVLTAACLTQAKTLVVTYSDMQTAEATIKQARMLSQNIPILVWAQTEKDIEYLFTAGATEVIPRNREANLMLESSLLRLLDVPIDDIMMRIQSACTTRYPMFESFFR